MGASTDTDPSLGEPTPPGPEARLDGSPSRPRVPTSPGLAPVPAEPPQLALAGPTGEVTPVLPPRTPGDKTAPNPPAPPVAMLLEGTPVPPEATDALLTGLLNGENASYFNKAKPSSESSGEAAVAYHAGPHALSAASPTPVPQPAVMLRRSVEMDIVSVAALGLAPAPGGVQTPESPAEDQGPPAVESSPPSARRMASAPTEMTLPFVVPLKGRWLDRWLAFAAAAAFAGVIGIVMVHWLSPVPPPETPAAAGPVTPTATTGPGPSAVAAMPAAPAMTIPPVPPAVDPPVAPADSPKPAALAPASAPPVTPSTAHAAQAVAPRSTGHGPASAKPIVPALPPSASAAPPVPPAKGDMKREI